MLANNTYSCKNKQKTTWPGAKNASQLTEQGVPSSEAATGRGKALSAVTLSALKVSLPSKKKKKRNVTCRLVNEVTLPLHLALCH